MAAPSTSARARAAYSRWVGLLGLATVFLLVVLVPPLDRILESHEALHHLQHAVAFLFSLLAGWAVHGLLVTASVHATGPWQRRARTLLVTNRHANPGGLPGLLFAAGLTALWHVPFLFNLAVLDDGVHILEHLSFTLAGGAVGASLPLMSRWTRLGGLLAAVLVMLFLSVVVVVFQVNVYEVYPYQEAWVFGVGMIYVMMPLMLYVVYRFLVAQVS